VESQIINSFHKLLNNGIFLSLFQYYFARIVSLVYVLPTLGRNHHDSEVYADDTQDEGIYCQMMEHYEEA
jgi:hypothetical protein